MKNLTDFITEKLEFEKSKINGWFTVVLYRHEDLDLANMTQEEFVKLIKEDIKKASDAYDADVRTLRQKELDKLASERADRMIKDAQKYAAEKWKTEKRREQYIQTIRDNIAKGLLVTKAEGVGFFDLKPDPTEMGINSNCIFYLDKLTDKQLAKAFDAVKNNKYFKKGTGWVFKYETDNKEIPVPHFRPWIDVILGDNDSTERERERQHHEQSIQDFYKDTKYWGD